MINAISFLTFQQQFNVKQNDKLKPYNLKPESPTENGKVMISIYTAINIDSRQKPIGSASDDFIAYAEKPTILVYVNTQEGLMKSTRLKLNNNTEIYLRL